MNYLIRISVTINVILMGCLSNAFADDPKEMMKDYSDRMIEILQGPVSKLFAAIILLIGVTALLRGRHGIDLPLVLRL